MFEDLKPHLAELRKRLFISVASVFAMFFVCFYFNEYILDILKTPVENVLPEVSKQMTFVELQEPLFTAMKVSFFSAFLISLPVIFWQFWQFVSPALYENEKQLVIPFVLFASIMFALGALFCYYVVIPLAFKFLVDFGVQTQDFKPLISIGLYVGFFTKLVIAFGLAFEMPVITFFFAKIGLIDDEFLKKHFRVSVLIIFIFSAMMTPPDVISQFLMAGPLCGLYGLSILIAKKVSQNNKEKEIKEEF